MSLRPRPMLPDDTRMLCQVCGEEVRFGWRDRQAGWWHRESADHPGSPTVAREPEYRPVEYPAPEVPATEVGLDDERVPRGCRSVVKLLRKHGWSVDRLTFSRGPRIGAGGALLGMSDTVAVRATRFDALGRFAVALWRRDGEGGWKFDFAHVGYIELPERAKVTATELKEWIRDI